MSGVSEWNRAQNLLERVREKGHDSSRFRLIDVNECGEVIPVSILPVTRIALREMILGSEPEVIRADIPLIFDQIGHAMHLGHDTVAALVEMERLPTTEVEGVRLAKLGDVMRTGLEVMPDGILAQVRVGFATNGGLWGPGPQSESAYATSSDWSKIRSLLELMAHPEAKSGVRLVGPDGGTRRVPERLISVVRSAAREMLLQREPMAVRGDLALTTTQAALAIPCEEEVIHLMIDRGHLPHRVRDGMTFVMASDLIAFGGDLMEDEMLPALEKLPGWNDGKYRGGSGVEE